jgi:hypothetical protein
MDERKVIDRRDSINITGTTARWWSLRKDALNAAARIGWAASCVRPVHNLMCRAFGLEGADGAMLTRERYMELCARSNSPAPPSSAAPEPAKPTGPPIASDGPPVALCKAGRHPDTAENRDPRGRCRLCQREWHRQHYLQTRQLKRKPCPRWNGTLEHLFALGWIQVRNGHWIWCHTINKRTQRPALGKRGPNPARRIWKLTGHEAIPDGFLLSHNRARCPEPFCVHPDCYQVLKRGDHTPPEARTKGLLTHLARLAAISIDDRIARRVVRDDTGCLRWMGRFEGKPGESQWAVLDFGGKTVNVRRYLWERKHGKIPPRHLLRHARDKACSYPDDCVADEHLYLQSCREFGILVLGANSPGRRPSPRQWIGGQEWPGTLWELGTGATCKHCRLSFEHHGANEWIGRKLGFQLNQLHRVCRPRPRSESVSLPAA